MLHPQSVIRRAAAVLALLLTPLSAAGQWKIFGSNELSVETYSVGGDDESASPFPFEGTFLSGRLDFNLARDDEQSGRRILLRAEVLGTNSDYFARQGVLLQTLSLRIENGGAAVPYRVFVGDVYTDFSRRVLQRDVRGVSIEMQPRLGGPGTHSFVVVTGGGEPDWRDAFERDFTFTGLSWLWQSDTGRSSLVANVVDARQDRGQRLASVYGATELAGLHLEGEAAFLDMDDDDRDGSVYAEVSRNGQAALQWRARFEQNGQAFAPIGGVGILANRRTGEVHVRYRAGTHTLLRGRAQRIEQNIEGGQPRLDTDLFGLDLERRRVAGRKSMRLRLYADRNEFRSDDGAPDRTFSMYGIDLEDRLGSLDVRGRLRRLETADRETRSVTEAGGDAGREFRRRDVSARVAAGVLLRDQEGEYRSWNPTFEASLRRGVHSLALHVGFIDQDFVALSADDLRYQTRRLIYAFEAGAHGVALEATEELREREPGIDTNSRRVALRYRYAFRRVAP
jgi:hypothetical protein